MRAPPVKQCQTNFDRPQQPPQSRCSLWKFYLSVMLPHVACPHAPSTIVRLPSPQRKASPICHPPATTRIEEGAEGTTEVAATAQQGAEAPVANSDGRTAAETLVDEEPRDWQMGNRGAEEAAGSGGAAEDGPGATAEAGTEGGPGAVAEAVAGTAAEAWPPTPAN